MTRWLVILVAFIALAAPASAQNFPPLTGRVVDQADLLDPAQEAALTAKLQNLETTTQRQFVVATVGDLQGYDIADYGYRLGREWALGDKERNDGLLLLVAPNDRKVRFEVGYGLEGYMTDAMSNDIIQNSILPAFRGGDFPGGINAGVDRAIGQLQLTPEEAAKVAAAAASREKSASGDGQIGMVLFWLFVFFFFILPVIMSFARGGRKYNKGRSRHLGGPVIIWGGGSDWGGSSGSSWGSSGGFGGGGFSGGGGSFGGGGASGGW